MTKRRQQRQRRVEHYIVQPQAYNAVIQLLGTLPYATVAGVLQDLTEGTQAVFEQLPGDKPPPSAKIVDTELKDKDPRTDVRALEDQPSPEETVEVDDTPPNVVELEVDPPANDNGAPLLCSWGHKSGRTYFCVVCMRRYTLAVEADDSYPPDRACIGPVENQPKESA